jgi:hypothetical protein
MKARLKTAVCAAVASVALASPVYGANVVVNQTLDLTKPQALPGPGFQGWQGTPAFNGGFNVAIGEGDTFDLTVDFLGAQTLTVSGLSQVWAYSYSEPISSMVTGTGTFSFLDASGTAFLTSDTKTDTEQSFHFGQQFFGSDFSGGLPGSITFWGVRYVGTLDDYVENGVTTRNYNTPAFYLTGTAVVGAVPEPETYAMLLVGLGLMGFVARRRKHKATA